MNIPRCDRPETVMNLYPAPIAMLSLLLVEIAMTAPAIATPRLHLTYPLAGHQTTADRIFLIGTAPPEGAVLVNGQPIARNAAGHFAPSFPLQLGNNQFTLQYQDQVYGIIVTRLPASPPAPIGLNFAKDSLQPAVDLARQPGELVCFAAIAPAKAIVAVQLGGQRIPLVATPKTIDLPANQAVLTGQNQPIATTSGLYQGCTRFQQPGQLGQPQFSLTLNGQTQTQVAPGRVEILNPAQFPVAEVTTESGTARTGPSTDYSRLTPLPQGSQALVTGREGEWLRLDYGAWIRSRETKVSNMAIPPRSLIRSLNTRDVTGWTEVRFPLQVAVPVAITQADRTFTLTLHNTTAQTDTIHLDDHPLIARLDWQQTSGDRLDYHFRLKSAQQWGYKLRYEGTTLVLSLRHPPARSANALPLQGITILLDPGHGGQEDLGARGPNGYPEKEVALRIAQLVRAELTQLGAKVYLTREQDIDVGLADRVARINQLEPTIALSLHYNALPDDGDALNTWGIAAFWYQPQAHSLAVFLHNYLVEKLNRPSYGVFWNNLALTRPAAAPAVMLELGFMIHPDEFEWIVDPQAQAALAKTIAAGISEWVTQETGI